MTGDLQQDANGTVVAGAKFLVNQRLDDAVSQGALLKEQQFRALTFD